MHFQYHQKYVYTQGQQTLPPHQISITFWHSPRRVSALGAACPHTISAVQYQCDRELRCGDKGPRCIYPRHPYTALWTHWICRHADRELSAVEESDLGYGDFWRALLYQTHVYRDCAAPCALPRMHTLPAHDACCMGKKYPAAGDATRTGIKIAQGI